MSLKRQAEQRKRAKIRAAVFERDRYRCQVAARVPDAGRCFGALTPHHIKKDGQGGSYTLDNLVSACAHHNERIESDADFARACEAVGLLDTRAGRVRELMDSVDELREELDD